MPIHLGGFGETVDQGGSLANIAALADQRLFYEGDNLRVPALNRVVGVAAGVPSGGSLRCRITSPTLDEIIRPEVRPVNGNADADAAVSDPPAIEDLRANPLTLGVDEMLSVETDHDTTSAQFAWCLLWFADGPVTPLSGSPIFTARATGSITLTVDVWTSGAITLDENLPPGRYQLVGMRAESAGLIAARVISTTGGNWRPGVLGQVAGDDHGVPWHRFGGLGVLTEFPFTQLPNFEFLSVSADTTETLFLDLIRIARGG